MADPLPHVERAREQLAPRWDERQVELLLVQLQRRMRRRTVARRAAAGVVCLAAIAAVGSWVRGGGPSPEAAPAPVAQAQPPAVLAPAPEAAVTPPPAESLSHVLHFLDGSTATLVGARSDLGVGVQDAKRISAEVRAGRVDFDVVRKPSRRFQVQVAEVKVSVLGTRFTVERQGSRAGVWVTEGRVLVEWAEGSQVLLPGESGWFPRPAGTANRAPAANGWKEHARQGDYGRAFELLRQVPPAELGDEVDELLLAADAARLSGHPAESVPFLEQVLLKHRTDARASLAAFTLGRVHLTQLSQPGKAAEAFAQVRALAPRGSLAEDALAREVEALWKAGDRVRARTQAELYLREYPSGTRRDWVQRLGDAPEE